MPVIPATQETEAEESLEAEVAVSLDRTVVLHLGQQKQNSVSKKKKQQQKETYKIRKIRIG